MSGVIVPNEDDTLPATASRPDPVDAGQLAVDGPSDVISVMVEQLRVDKRRVEGESVRVRVLTDEEAAPANVILRSERIEVEHVPIGRVVDHAPPVREENGVTIVPVMEEIVVTETRLVLKEELHIRRIAETREHQQTVPLRRQRAEVEQLPATGRPLTEASTPSSIKDPLQ